jgi:N utilization substance protein B
MLFQWEVGGINPPAALEEGFWLMARAERSTREFANELFEGAAARTPEIDALLASHSKEWRVERMGAIDRAILRLAAYELSAGKTPPKVVINEAVELAKAYSTAEAAPFINGILDSLMKSLKTERSAEAK